MDIKVEVQGLKGLEDALAEAGPKIARKVVRQGLMAAADVVLGAVKARTPVLQKGTPQRRPGELRDAMTKKIRMSPKEESGEVVIGAEYKKADGSQSPGVYDKFVEFGSVHNVAKPHMRPGFDESKQAALDAFTQIAREGVDSLKK
jgi:HK97 gp10 family phage protein